MGTGKYLLLASFLSSALACGGIASTTLGSGSGGAGGKASTGVGGMVSTGPGGSVSIGAGGMGSPTVPTDLGLPDCVRVLFADTRSCGGSVCHSGGSGVSPDLSSPGVASRLIDQPALFPDVPPHTDVPPPASGSSGSGGQGGAEAVTQAITPIYCPAGAKLIDTKNRAASWLLLKVQGKQGNCGLAMPEIGVPLTNAQLTCLVDWVDTVQPGGT